MPKLWIATVTQTVVVYTEDDTPPSDWNVKYYTKNEDLFDAEIREATSLPDVQQESGWGAGDLVYGEHKSDMSLHEAAKKVWPPKDPKCPLCGGKGIALEVDAINPDGSVENPRKAVCMVCDGSGLRQNEDTP